MDRQEEPATERCLIHGNHPNDLCRLAGNVVREARVPAPLDVESLRNWLRDQSRQAHEQANILPGDPAHAWDAGAAHMADATLTRLSTLAEQAQVPAPLDVERLTAAIHWHYCGGEMPPPGSTTALGMCGYSDAHRRLAETLVALMPSNQPSTEPAQGGTTSKIEAALGRKIWPTQGGTDES